MLELGWEDRSHRAESYLQDISSGQILPGQQKAKVLELFTFQALASKKKKTAIPTDMEIKSFLTHFTWAK